MRNRTQGHRPSGDRQTVTTSWTTNGEAESYDIVINAAGPWAGRVGDLLGHPVPLLPQVHEVVQVRLPRELDYVVPMVNLYMPGQAGEALYFRQDGPDSLIAGMHTYAALDHLANADPDNYRSKVSTRTISSKSLRPSPSDSRSMTSASSPGWTGIYPLSPDSKFILGPESDPTVVTCAGLGGVGVTMGSIAGATAAEWAIEGKPTTVPVDHRAPSRPGIPRCRPSPANPE